MYTRASTATAFVHKHWKLLSKYAFNYEAILKAAHALTCAHISSHVLIAFERIARARAGAHTAAAAAAAAVV